MCRRVSVRVRKHVCARCRVRMCVCTCACVCVCARCRACMCVCLFAGQGCSHNIRCTLCSWAPLRAGCHERRPMPVAPVDDLCALTCHMLTIGSTCAVCRACPQCQAGRRGKHTRATTSSSHICVCTRARAGTKRTGVRGGRAAWTRSWMQHSAMGAGRKGQAAVAAPPRRQAQMRKASRRAWSSGCRGCGRACVCCDGSAGSGGRGRKGTRLATDPAVADGWGPRIGRCRRCV